MKRIDVAPDVVIELTADQKAQIAKLTGRRKILQSGLIIGSVGLSGETIGLSFIPQKIGEQIRDLANRELGGQTNVNS